VSEFLSIKMKTNNPMKDPVISKKVSEILKNREYLIRGSDHWLWKGNRDRCQTIRTRLYKPWIRPILERDNFTCSKCNKRGGRLEVHHVNPTFREIVDLVLQNRKMDELSNKEFAVVSDEIVDIHKKCVGITYCVACHKQVDRLRH